MEDATKTETLSDAQKLLLGLKDLLGPRVSRRPGTAAILDLLTEALAINAENERWQKEALDNAYTRQDELERASLESQAEARRLRVALERQTAEMSLMVPATSAPAALPARTYVVNFTAEALKQNKIRAIHAWRIATDDGLKEAKERVEDLIDKGHGCEIPMTAEQLLAWPPTGGTKMPFEGVFVKEA